MPNRLGVFRARKVTVGAACLLAAASAVTACGKPANSTSTAAPANVNSAQAAQKVIQTGPTCPGHNTGLTLKNAVVGFSQSEALSNPFRAVETDSVRSEAQTLGVKKFLYTNANADPAKQVADIQDLLNEGANILIIAPENATGLQSVLAQAHSKGVPVFLIDRDTAGTICQDFETFAGSDFTQQAQRAAQQLIQATGGTAKIAELDGTPGNLVATDRAKGFSDTIASHPGMKIVAEQTGNFTLSGGEQVMAQIIQAHPDINAVYAQNDEMALGAITALDNAGKKPGQDVKIVSIDGTKQVIQDIISGQVVADVETNPRFGPLIFGAIQSYLAGKPVYQRLVTTDELYTKANAAKLINVQGY